MMKISKADRKAWAVVAESIKHFPYPVGLCTVLRRTVLRRAVYAGDINLPQKNRMLEQLLGSRGLYSNYDDRSEAYLWPRNYKKSRIEACLYLAGLRKTAPRPKWSN